MRLKYTDRSRDDLELAFTWYERQRRGLGFEFLDCVEATLKTGMMSPDFGFPI
jgi:toxin ParE1/3/4